MTTAEHILEEIRSLPAMELRAVWREVNEILIKLDSAPNTGKARKEPRQEVLSALECLSGCTADRPVMPRLMADRALERTLERAKQEARVGSTPKRHQ